MGESQTPHFYDLMIFGCVQTLQNQLFLSLETPGHLTKNQEIPGTFSKHMFVYKSHNFRNPFVVNFRKTGTEK